VIAQRTRIDVRSRQWWMRFNRTIPTAGVVGLMLFHAAASYAQPRPAAHPSGTPTRGAGGAAPAHVDELDALVSQRKFKRAIELVAAREADEAKKKLPRKSYLETQRRLRASLEARLAHVTLAVPQADQYTVDGEPAIGNEVTLDPGPHSLNVRGPLEANGARRQRAEQLILAEGQRVLINWSLPPLLVAPVSPSAAPTSGNAQRTAGWLTAGVGVVALGVGTYFAVSAKNQNDELSAACPQSVCAKQFEGIERSRDRDATLSTIFVASGAVALAVGITLVLTAKSRPHTTTNLGTLGVGTCSLRF
jgi:hypothetical protein